MVNLVEKLENHIDILELKNDSLSVTVTNLGCTVMKILTADKDGRFRDMVLGYDTIQEYQEHTGYLGAFVGRVANRIGGASFELNGKTYQLAKNSGPNAIHGGIEGFSNKVFSYTTGEDEIVFTYTSPDGEEGYPGELNVTVTYRLEADKFILQYEAHTDQDTILNFTNHSYFNLSGRPCGIGEHWLQTAADCFACVDENGLVTGEIRDVAGTPFDFRNGGKLGEHLQMEDEQLKIGHGFDHPFIFRDEKEKVKLYCEESGIEMIVETTLPQAQIYTANFLEPHKGKGGDIIDQRTAICVETQNMPDSIHKEENPTVILRAGDTYREMTSYRFHVIGNDLS